MLIHIYVSDSFYTVIDDRLGISDGVILAFSVSNGFSDNAIILATTNLHLITDERESEKGIFYFSEAG